MESDNKLNDSLTEKEEELDMLTKKIITNLLNTSLEGNKRKGDVEIPIDKVFDPQVFNRNYNLLFKNYEKRYVKIASLSNKMIKQWYSKQKISAIATLLRLKLKEKVKISRFLKQDNFFVSINMLTSNIDKKQHDMILDYLLKSRIVDNIQENNGVISLKTTSYGEIKFSTIKKFFPDLEEDLSLDNIDKRTGNCHLDSCIYAKKLKQIGVENDVVTADRLPITDAGRGLHSWNEFSINGKDHVLDYTQNFVMNKEGYYALNHIEEIISRINCNVLEEDLKIMRNINVGLKTYLTSRDEIMKDLERNLKFFDSQER